MEPEIKIKDLSPWHHLIFVEELADDISDKAECNLCREQAVGPVYKSLECDFIQHKSCPNPIQEDWGGDMKGHYYEERHHLMLVEEVKNRAEEEVVCWGCQEPTSLLAYKCSKPGCSFLLDKSCTELSHAVLHPQHSDHMLTLQARDLRRGSRGKDKRCNGCKKLIECFYYGCRRCNVYLHPKCSAPEMELQLEPQPEPKDCSPWHHLIFVQEFTVDVRDKAYCRVCNEQAVGPFYKCLECDFIQHKSCPNQTRASYHCFETHHLMLVEEVENRAEEEVVCWGCQEPPSFPVYRCSNPGCSFLLDKSCTELSHAVLHPQHSDHVLTLQPIDPTMGAWGEDKRCNGCNKLIECLYYGCRRCNVYLHPKCSAPEMELEVEPLPLREDLSPWHHLIFVEELADVVSDKANCTLCREQAVGPVYKCLECNFIRHKSCPNATERNWEERTYHDCYYQWRHELILVEEVENRAEQEVVCWGCQEPPSFPMYKCALPGCTFLLHKSCAELSSLVVVHPMHSDHVLTLQTELFLRFTFRTEGKNCNACATANKSSLFYGCNPCDFYLHIKCLSHFQFNADDCHKHTVVVARRVDRFTCQACGVECKDFAYMCNVCQLIMERDCADFPHSIQTTLHGPSLIFIHSVCLINKKHRVLCRLCRKQVNTRYGAYYCDKCGYILHLRCVRRYEDKGSTTESESKSCEEHTIYLLDWLRAAEDERVDEKFKHFDHPQHELTLSHEEPGNDKKCKACMHFLFFAPYYGCVECNFFLHVRCAKLPTNIRRGLLHEHPLTLTASLLWCGVCNQDQKGYGYRCDKCDEFEAHVKCGLLPESLEHVLHEHILFLVRESERLEERCNVCGVRGVWYVCTDCEFRLCGCCVAFPPAVRCRYHPHPLTVTFIIKRKKDNYCLICEKNVDKKQIFYWCKKCDFTVDSKCILEDHYDSLDSE